MPLDKDYYQILQVKPSAEPEIIRAAYKRQSRKYHPDTNKSPDATRRMQDINEAYAILSDPQKRAEYDRRKGHPTPETEAERQARERQQKLATLYERGMQLFSQNKWADAMAVFDELLALDPAYRDAQARRQAAQQALEKRRRAEKLAQLYREAMEHFRAERWTAAIEAFKEIQRLDPDDRYMAHLLREADQKNRLANLYAEAEKYMRLEAWREAIIRFDNILSQSPNYRDVAERLKQAQQQQWIADLTDQAIEYFQQKRFSEAERIWAQIRQIRDSDVSSPVPPQPRPASPSAASSSTRPTWQMDVGILAVLALLVIGFVMIMSGLTPTHAPTQVPRPIAIALSTSAPPTLRSTALPARSTSMIIVPPKTTTRPVPATPSATQYIRPIIPMPRDPPSNLPSPEPTQPLRPMVVPATSTPLPDYLIATPYVPMPRNPPRNLSSPAPTQPPRPTATAALVLSTSAPAAVTTRIAGKDGMVMVYVPAGEFLMGSADSDKSAQDNEKPQHTVYLDAFWIDRTEVTNAQYQKCVQAKTCNASRYADNSEYNGDTQPVVGVDWNDAKTYCGWAGEALPTEAQWEKAARGTDGRAYPWGNNPPTGKLLNLCGKNCDPDWKDSAVDDGYARAAPVGSYLAGTSPYGALDMAGNVWEWVADWYDAKYYASSPSKNPTGPSSGSSRVLRGGSWDNVAMHVRAAVRGEDSPDARAYAANGFRCVGSGPGGNH